MKHFTFCMLTLFVFVHLQAQWVQTSLDSVSVSSFVVSGTNLFAGTEGDGVFLSTNYGTNWTEVNNGLTDPYVRALAVSDTNLFAGTFGGVFLSTNNGTSWTSVNNGLTNTYVRAFAVSGTNLFAGTEGGGVFLSTNYGTNWTEVNDSLTDPYVSVLAASGMNLFAGTGSWGEVGGYGAVFLSTNNGASWTELELSGYITALFNSPHGAGGKNLFVGTHSWYGVMTHGGIHLSTNNGETWTRADSGLSSRIWVNDFVASLDRTGGTNLFAASGNSFSFNEGGGCLSFQKQRLKLDGGRFWPDESLCPCPCRHGHESFCRN